MAVTGKKDVYFSVDIEADGPYPGTYSMSSFGIALVGEYDGGILTRPDAPAEFYAELKPISTQWVPEAAAVSGLDRSELWKHGLAPEDAMSEAADFINRQAGSNRAVFAAYPLGFDWLFMYWYFMKYNDGKSPFGHSNHIDIKTLFAAKAGVTIGNSIKRKWPKELDPKLPHTHNALDDAREQGERLALLLEWNRAR